VASAILVGGLAAGGVFFGLPTYSLARGLLLASVIVSVPAGILLLAWRYVRSMSAIGREQVRIVLIGCGLAFLPFLGLSIVPNAVTGEYIVEPEVTALAAVLVPVSFAYSITRRQLMGIRRLVHRAVGYSLVTAAAFFAYATAVWALGTFVDIGSAGRLLEVALLVALIVGAPLVAGVRNTAFRMTDKLLYRYNADLNEVLRDLSVEAVISADNNAYFRDVLNKVQKALDIEGAAYLELVDGARARVLDSVGKISDEAVGMAANAVRANGLARSQLQTMPSPGSEGFLLVSPVAETSNNSRTFLLAGPKTSGETSSREEEVFIQAVSNLMRSSLERSLELERLERQSTEALEMLRQYDGTGERLRSDIASYLHDEPLQKISVVLARLRELAVPEELTITLQEAANDLRNTSAVLGTDMLRDLGLVRSCEWLVQQAGNRSQMRILFESSEVTRQTRLETEVEIAAYRMVQEAINNALNHSRGTAVWVKLRLQDRALVIEVEDNGVGIDQTVTASSQSDRPHLGLASIRRQITHLGGRFAVSRRVSRGTRVYVEVPVGPARQHAQRPEGREETRGS
jgi:two-component system sensor histidine kinase ComP